MSRKLELIEEIIAEISIVGSKIDDAQAEALCREINAANTIFVAGAGRSGLCTKSFAMRLMHLGYDVYVVGEIVTPNLKQGDLLIIGSGSGNTATMVAMAKKAKEIGGKIALVTASSKSLLADLSDSELLIPLPVHSEMASIQPEGSLFEEVLFLIFEVVILKLVRSSGVDLQNMFQRHANLE